MAGMSRSKSLLKNRERVNRLIGELAILPTCTDPLPKNPAAPAMVAQAKRKNIDR
jgi:hypothetical protein